MTVPLKVIEADPRAFAACETPLALPYHVSVLLIRKKKMLIVSKGYGMFFIL